MKAPTRLYLVADGDSKRLVRAVSPAQALAHVARTAFSVTIPSQDDLLLLGKSGIEVETAGKEAAE